MAKTVTIPAGDNPFICKINDVYYSYPAGATVEVPDEVAALIQANAGNREKSNGLSDIAIPRDGETGNVLTRTADGAKWATPAAPEPELPSVSGSDNGKVLKVVEGAWAAASGGGVLVVGYDYLTGALDKTWQEINDAPFAVIKHEEEGLETTDIVITTIVAEDIFIVGVAAAEAGESSVSWYTKAFSANSADAYPVEMG